MNGAGRRDILKKLGVALWAMATLVLLFCVLLLVREMINRGENPFESFRAAPAGSIAEPAAARPAAPGGTREVQIYFGSGDGRYLAAETHTIEYSASSVENCRQALQRLIAGPRDLLTPVIPASVKVRAIYLLDDGELVVDFSGEMLSEQLRFKSASLEALMAYAVVNTLTQSALQAEQDPPVRRVRFLFEGTPPQEAFPAHIDLSAPLTPNARWIETAPDAPAHG
jgi:spore germination protein GerM